jgi:N-acetylglucosaminyldiphosphoundecaprenol N-acetyl-beta-D-mannosaminyltransferase
MVHGEKKAEKPLMIVTPNPEQVVRAQTDKRFAEILNRADIAIPDGIGLVWAMRLLNGKQKVERIPGVELMEDLVLMAVKRGYPIACIGGRGGAAGAALSCLQRRYPGLAGWAEEPDNTTNSKYYQYYQSSNTINGAYDPYLREIAQKILKTTTRLVFVGLGAPKQEYFIEKLTMSLRDRSDREAISQNDMRSPRSVASGDLPRDDKGRGVVLMSVGGAFDMIAGRIPRAPYVVRSMGLEWLWRLVREPWRWRRQRALLKFIWLVIYDGMYAKSFRSEASARVRNHS